MKYGASHDDDWIDVVVHDSVRETGDVLSLVLGRAGGGALPRWSPGSHVAVRCGTDIVRHYSLCGPSEHEDQYRLGVKLEPESRGGSRWLEENAHPGATLRVSRPRDRFPLVFGKARYLFISGGIGMTPILAMLRRLRQDGIGARWVHLCRSPEDLAFRDSVSDLASFHDVHVHYDSIAGGLYDLNAELQHSAPDTEVYCCGPAPIMNLVRDFAERQSREDRFHFEFFATPEAVDSDSEPPDFVVVQHSTGREIRIGESDTMLSALRAAGIQMASECEYGVCGHCATSVVSGVPEHRDSYLTQAERASNKIVMPCVSRCQGDRIELDI
jgi:ferredoxin-NADP reductase